MGFDGVTWRDISVWNEQLRWPALSITFGGAPIISCCALKPLFKTPFRLASLSEDARGVLGF
jgi:hypothetical protein